MERIISLEGFMGCGKSSSGKVLASLLRLPFVDLDEYIEKRSGRSIPDIFSAEGNDYFRELEHECLMEVLGTDEGSFVLSLGGGTPCRKENADAIRNRTLCIYLRASEEELKRNLEGTRAGRPVLKSASVEELLKRREPIYSQLAEITVDVDGLDETAVAYKIKAELESL